MAEKTNNKERKQRKSKSAEMRFLIYHNKKDNKKYKYGEFSTEKEATLAVKLISKTHIVKQLQFQSFVNELLELSKNNNNEFELSEFCSDSE